MKKEKTIHELVKEFPDKSYRELEIYRDADRQEEAARIPLTESQQKQKELEPIEDEIGACITASMQRDKVATELQVMKRRAQEAEGELSILKGIETNRVKEAQTRCNQLQDELDRVKKENNDLFTRVADSLEVNESHQKMNGKLQTRLTDLEEENKKLHAHVDKHITEVRKAGL
jgi:chromosome segregation ATPase